MSTTATAKAMIACPGCGGRGRFDWGPNDKVPRQWSSDAPCGMCGGQGQVPASWVKAKKPAR